MGRTSLEIAFGWVPCTEETGYRVHNIILRAEWNVLKICWFSRNGHNWSLIFLFERENFRSSVFQSFLSCFLFDVDVVKCMLSPLLGVKDRVISFDDLCMQILSPMGVEHAPYSLSRVILPSLRRAISSYRRLHTIVSFGSQPWLIFSSESLSISFIRGQMLVIISFKNFDFSNWRLKSVVFFIDLLRCNSVYNRSLSSHWVRYVGLTYHKFTSRMGIVLNFSSWSPVLYINLWWKVNIILYISGGCQYYLVFSVRSLKFVPFDSLFVPLFVIQSAYITPFTRNFPWHIVFFRRLGQSDSPWPCTYTIRTIDRILFGGLDFPFWRIGGGLNVSSWSLKRL